MKAGTSDRCPVCGARGPAGVDVVEGAPALCNAFAARADEARAMPRGVIDLVACGHCGMLWNRAFDSELAPYDSRYENSLHFSPRFRVHADQLATTLAARHGGDDAVVVEIGSGTGDFLDVLAGKGFATGLGLDPSLAAPSEHSSGSATVRLLPGTVRDAPAGTSASLIVCRHVLEHVDRPVDLLRNARTALARPGTALYVEVPDAGHMLAAGAVWDLIYEHVGYFTEPALVRTVRSAGWDVTDHGSAFGGQYLWVCAVAGGEDAGEADDRDAGAQILALAGEFRRRRAASIARWRSFLDDAKRSGRRVAVWGAGSKGVTFVNSFPHAAPAVVDVSPRKHGCFVPGTGARVAAPAELVGNVDVVLVMNPLYVDEVRRLCADLGVAADVMAVDE